MSATIGPQLSGLELGPRRSSWDERDHRLYALAVGAGAADPLGELQFTTQNTAGVTQQALPTFAVLPGCQVGVRGLLEQLDGIDTARMLHGSQRVELFQALPLEAEVETAGRVLAVWDKGKAAVVETEAVTRDVASGRNLFRCIQSLFFRGYGGWGGDRGPASAHRPAGRAPDRVLVVETRPDQALLYRLTGDNNPLHSDPGFARRAGFDRPILHGLCVYGSVARAIVTDVLAGEAGALTGLSGRFSAPVYPGERLTVHLWEQEGGWSFRVSDRADTAVMSDGLISTR